MYKKIMYSLIGLLVVFLVFIFVWYFTNNSTETEENAVNVGNAVNVSEEKVTDECTEEYEEYIKEINSKIEEASNNLSEDDTNYLVKDVNGYIFVYYLDGDKNEFLYKRTTISTDYLSQEDKDDLEVGIEVIGIENLNKLLEDFE